MKLIPLSLALSLALASCNKTIKKEIPSSNVPEKHVETAIEFKNKAHQIIYETVQKTGTYQDLLSKKDVVYHYSYTLPNGKEDVSTEKYIFNNELSFGEYHKHERTFPELKGKLTQGYNGEEFWLKDGDSIILDPKKLKMVAFKRPTNFYWFAMIQKLLDPNLNYEYIEQTLIDDIEYDVVKVTFNTEGDKPSDIYQVYVNKSTKLIDQFLFTVVDFGRMDPLLMKVQYENVDGILIPSKRKYTQSNWKAEIQNENWAKVNWTQIKFDNNLKLSNFSK